MLVIYGSSRQDENTERLVDIITSGVTVEKIYLRELRIVGLFNSPHEMKECLTLNDEYFHVVTSVLSSEKILFVTPVYENGMSQYIKNLFDFLTINYKGKMKHKNMYVLVVGGNHQSVSELITEFHRIFKALGAYLKGYIIGEGNQANAIREECQAVQQAKMINHELINFKKTYSPLEGGLTTG